MSVEGRVLTTGRETMSSVITTNPNDPRFNPIKVTQGKNDPVLVLQKLYHYNNFQNKPLQANFISNKYRNIVRKQSQRLSTIEGSDRDVVNISPTRVQALQEVAEVPLHSNHASSQHLEKKESKVATYSKESFGEVPEQKEEEPSQQGETSKISQMTKEMKRMFEKADSYDSDSGDAVTSSDEDDEEAVRQNQLYEYKFKVSNLYEKLKGVDPDYKMPKKLIIQQSSVNIPQEISQASLKRKSDIDQQQEREIDGFSFNQEMKLFMAFDPKRLDTWQQQNLIMKSGRRVSGDAAEGYGEEPSSKRSDMRELYQIPEQAHPPGKRSIDLSKIPKALQEQMSLETSVQESKKNDETPQYLKQEDESIPELTTPTVRTAPHSYAVPKSHERNQQKILEFQDFKAPFTSAPRVSRPPNGKKLSQRDHSPRRQKDPAPQNYLLKDMGNVFNAGSLLQHSTGDSMEGTVQIEITQPQTAQMEESKDMYSTEAKDYVSKFMPKRFKRYPRFTIFINREQKSFERENAISLSNNILLSALVANEASTLTTDQGEVPQVGLNIPFLLEQQQQRSASLLQPPPPAEATHSPRLHKAKGSVMETEQPGHPDMQGTYTWEYDPFDRVIISNKGVDNSLLTSFRTLTQQNNTLSKSLKIVHTKFQSQSKKQRAPKYNKMDSKMMTPIEFLEFKSKLQERKGKELEKVEENANKMGGTYLQPQEVNSPASEKNKEVSQSLEDLRNRSPSPSNQAQLFFGNAAQEKRVSRKSPTFGERVPSNKEFYLPVKVQGQRSDPSVDISVQDLHKIMADKSFQEKVMLKKSLVQLGSPKVETPYTSLNSVPRGVSYKDTRSRGANFIPSIPRINKNKPSLASASQVARAREHSQPVTTTGREDGIVKVNESNANMEEEVKTASKIDKTENPKTKIKTPGAVKKIRTMSVLTQEESFEDIGGRVEQPRSPRIVMNKNTGPNSSKGRSPMNRSHYKRSAGNLRNQIPSPNDQQPALRPMLNQDINTTDSYEQELSIDTFRQQVDFSLDGTNTRTAFEKTQNETQTKFNNGAHSPTPNSMVQMMPNYGRAVKGNSSHLAERNLKRGVGRNSVMRKESPRYEDQRRKQEYKKELLTHTLPELAHSFFQLKQSMGGEVFENRKNVTKTSLPPIHKQNVSAVLYQKKERASSLLENSVLFNLNRVHGTKNSSALRKGEHFNLRREISRQTGVPEEILDIYVNGFNPDAYL